jgi:hypothetical protein
MRVLRCVRSRAQVIVQFVGVDEGSIYFAWGYILIYEVS